MISVSIITIFSLIVLLFSIAIHELAHGYMANFLGDPTAKYAGRLTLNPFKHLDFFGSIVFPFFMLLLTAGQGPIFGWAKPVPINPYNFKDQKWGTLKVALAGPLTNFTVAIIFGLIIRFFQYPALFHFLNLLSIIVLYNFLWGVFNLIPIPPLDGAWILFKIIPQKFETFKIFLEDHGLLILILFIITGGLRWIGLLAEILYEAIVGSKIWFF